jgi:3-oxoacyl-[acyl-carrier protein] reductase
MNELKGKSALITGASRGIGAATARCFARLGIHVVLAARSTSEIEALAREIGQSGAKAEAIACDVTKYEDVAAATSRCISAYGRIDILVNNAGTIDPIARIGQSDPKAWDQVVDINLKGVYHGLRAAIPAMEKTGGGVIVNLSSGAATGALEGWSHYCATKAAVLSLTRCAHLEYGDAGIRVVGLSPGTVATDMQVSIKSSGINPVSKLEPSAHISPDWCARAIAYLCTADAAEFAGTDFSLKNDKGRRRAGLME